MLTITPLYLAVAVVMYFFISVFVIRNRRRLQVSIGDGGDPHMARIVRGHGNFAEYAPIGLLAMTVAELAGAPALAIHSAGVLLLAGRALHAYCFLFTSVGMRLRVSGMMLTFFSLWTSALAALLVSIG